MNVNRTDKRVITDEKMKCKVEQIPAFSYFMYDDILVLKIEKEKGKYDYLNMIDNFFVNFQGDEYVQPVNMVIFNVQY